MFARDWRNRWLAHGDLELHVNPDAQPLEAASRLHVTQALTKLVAVLDRVEEHYRGGGTDFSTNDRDATTLLHIVRDGLLFAEKRMQRIESGEWTPEDLARPDL